MGLVESARAMATRCCSPPESWPGKCGFAMGEPDFRQSFAGDREGVVLLEEFHRQRHVLDGRHGRHEVEGLEHDADIGGTKPGQAVFVEGAEIGADDRNAAGGGALEPGDDHEKGGFARAAGAHNRHSFARRHR